MTPAQAAGILGIGADAPWEAVRQAYRDRIRAHHPDVSGPTSSGQAVRIIEAYRTLLDARGGPGPGPAGRPPGASPPPAPPPRPSGEPRVDRRAPAIARVDADTVAIAAPADEAFRWLIEAAHDIGEITYLDRSGPILEVLCRFEGEPATSLMITIQGRTRVTEAFCTVESIESRPAPPTPAVVDLLELALRRRQDAAD